MLVERADRRRSLVARFAACFEDHRDPDRVEHTVERMLRHWIFGLALGYEDLNDHDELRRDPLLAALVGKRDSTGAERRQARDEGKALAGKSTLNRLEWSAVANAEVDRYHRVALRPEAVDRFFVDALRSSMPTKNHPNRSRSTSTPLHGTQEGRFFHGYYGCYCYLPLVFCGSHVLCARLRRSSLDASSGAVEEVERIVGQIRERWPDVVVVRGDSGFAREALMG